MPVPPGINNSLIRFEVPRRHNMANYCTKSSTLVRVLISRRLNMFTSSCGNIEHRLAGRQAVARSTGLRQMPRCFASQEPIKQYDFVKESSKKGPIRWAGLLITVLVGGAAVYYVKEAKDEMEKKKEQENRRSVGKAAIGGPFTLINHLGKTVTSLDFLGQWLILYFGFTHCPDVCPDTLEKLHSALDIIDSTKDSPGKVQPLFITVDPARDDVETVAEYIKEFHPRLVGLTGTEDQVKETCKTYRVYYSAGPADADNDYIVDHSVILYLVDPDGQFVDYFGQNMDEREIANTTISHMLKYKLTHRK